jgi:FAD:protein FMN transferase
LVEIEAAAKDSAMAHRAIDRAFECIGSIHRSMSRFDDDSDVGRLNRSCPGAAVPICRQTARVLKLAEALRQASAGVFDIRSSGNRGAHARTLKFGRGHVARSDEATFDLGGIAKGYAVDAALKSLRADGMAWACVNAGGDLAGFGRSIRVHVRHPARPRLMLQLVDLHNAAVATSAHYADPNVADFHQSEYLGSEGESHRAPGRSVSVLAPKCCLADALTKLVWITGDVHHPLLARCSAKAIILDDHHVCA